MLIVHCSVLVQDDVSYNAPRGEKQSDLINPLTKLFKPFRSRVTAAAENAPLRDVVMISKYCLAFD